MESFFSLPRSFPLTFPRCACAVFSRRRFRSLTNAPFGYASSQVSQLCKDYTLRNILVTTKNKDSWMFHSQIALDSETVKTYTMVSACFTTVHSTTHGLSSNTMALLASSQSTPQTRAVLQHDGPDHLGLCGSKLQASPLPHKPNIMCVKAYIIVSIPARELSNLMWDWGRRGEWDLFLNPQVR